MADIIIDDITNSINTGIFDRLMSAVDSRIESQYLNNRITGSDYANVYLGSIQSVLQAAVQYNLQEQLTEAQIDGIAADNLLKAKQLEIAEKELDLKTTESNRLRDTTEAELEKQWGYDVTRDGVTGELILGDSDGGGRIDKEISKLTADADAAASQADIAYASLLSSLDKELGYGYSLDVNDELVRSSLTNSADGKLDVEIKLLEQKVVGKKQSAVLGE